MLPNRSAAYSQLSWADIKVQNAKERLQTFHARSKTEKKRVLQSERQSRGHIFPKPHSKVEIEGKIMNTIVAVGSVSLAKDAFRA